MRNQAHLWALRTGLGSKASALVVCGFRIAGLVVVGEPERLKCEQNRKGRFGSCWFPGLPRATESRNNGPATSLPSIRPIGGKEVRTATSCFQQAVVTREALVAARVQRTSIAALATVWCTKTYSHQAQRILVSTC